MPLVLVLDLSLSMARKIPISDDNEEWTRFKLALRSIRIILDTLAAETKWERVCLIGFSRSYEIICPFTDDFSLIKSKLAALEELCIAEFVLMLNGVNKYVLSELGPCTACQVIVITDSDPSAGVTPVMKLHLPFKFHGRLIILSISSDEEPVNVLRKILYLSGANGKLCRPAVMSSLASFDRVIADMVVEHFKPFIATVKCGALSTLVHVHPSPVDLPTAVNGETFLCNISDTFDVCGFINNSDLGTPGGLSLHSLIPVSSVFHVHSKRQYSDYASAQDDPVEEDNSHIPCFAVILCKSLKANSMSALCRLNTDWYGVLYAHHNDVTNTSNLALLIFHPGTNPVPWFGDLKYLGFRLNEKPAEDESFPVKPPEKRSYNQNLVVWIKHTGLQADVAKILRQARKLPEKTANFYKELNRVRRAALSFGFTELLEGLADIFDRECTLLPATAHPDCALQLTHASGILRKPIAIDAKYTIQPMKTKFLTELDTSRI